MVSSRIVDETDPEYTSSNTQISIPTRYYYETTRFHVCCQQGVTLTPSNSSQTPIYLTNRFLAVKNLSSIYSFELVRNDDKKIIAKLYLTQESSQIWSSLTFTPFGGIQLYETCMSKEVEFLLKCVENFVKIQQGRKIIIKTAPCNYSIFGSKKLNFAYRQAGFRIERALSNHYIPITEHSFESLISKAEYRRLRKCQKACFLSAIPHENESHMIYNFITSSRERKGYKLSISSVELANQIRAFPRDTVMFAVYHGEMLIAAAVTVLVTKDILYNFLPADHDEFRSFSPTVLLTASMYAYCQKNGIKQLDLGTSADHNGIEKSSLIRFKENIGGLASQKITWEKTLNAQAVSVTVKNR